MNADTLLNALGGIDDDLIRAADQDLPRRRQAFRWQKLTALAACLALLAAGTFGMMLLPGNRAHTPPVLGEETSESVTTTRPVETTTSVMGTSPIITRADYPYVIVTIVEIAEEFFHGDYRRIVCQVLYVNSTHFLDGGPYCGNTNTHLILAQETVDIFFPSDFVSFLEVDQTLLFLLDNACINDVYYYVPRTYSSDYIPFIFYEEGKMVLNDELELSQFCEIAALNEYGEYYNQRRPDLNYDEIKFRNGISVEETIAFFAFWEKNGNKLATGEEITYE